VLKLRSFCADEVFNGLIFACNGGRNGHSSWVIRPADQLAAEKKLESKNRFGAHPTEGLIETRHYPRFKLDIDLKIYPRAGGLVMGRTVDISEGGLAAMLKIEVPRGQVVRLEFRLALGLVWVRALVHQRNAFRYGFQFVEPDSVGQELIRRSCREFASGT